MHMIEPSAPLPPKMRWSVEGFAYFWSTSRDPAIVGDVVWPDVTGHWPCASGPLIGRDAYIKAIANFLDAVPFFSARVTDHAVNGDVAFVRWAVEGEPPVGPSTIIGVDRLILRQGHVQANHIHSDHPVFQHLAKQRLLG